MKKTIFIFIFWFVFFNCTAQVYKTMYFDFGPSDITNGNVTTGPDANGNYWSNITNTANGSVFNIIDNKNVSTGSTATVSTGFSSNGIQNGGLLNPNPTFLNDFAIPTATQDYFHTSTSGTITISGLNKSRGYVFKLFGSRNDPEKRVTTYTLQGRNSSSNTLQTSGLNLGGTGYNGNNSTVVVSNRIMPDSSGKITLNIARTEGSFGYLAEMKMEEVPFCSNRNSFGITFMGSSVPYGYLIPDNHGYVYQYDQLLKARNSSGTGKNWSVSNISVPGNNTINVLDRWDSDLVGLCNKYVVYALSLGNEGITTGGQATFNQFRDNLQLLISKARAEGMTPIIANCYSRGDYGPTEYNFVKQMNVLIHSWDVPSINLLGALDNGAGQWASGYTADPSHPNYEGHQEFMYSIVPSLFDALDAGKPQPNIVTNASINLNPSLGYKLEFKGEEIIHPFTLSYDIKTSSNGVITEFNTQSGLNNITLSNGKLNYNAATSAGIAGNSIVNDNLWHRVTITHYYALGKTLLYVDNALQGSVNEKLVPTTFSLNTVNSPNAAYRNLCFYRSALSNNEISELVANHLLKSSLEIYSPLDGQASDSLLNLAQSNNKIKKSGTSTIGLVTVYADIDYTGFSGGLSTGNYTLAQLQALGVKDNDITSVKVTEGYKVILYSDDNFTGTSATITSNSNYIGAFNDQITSIRVIANGTAGLGNKTYYLKNRHSSLYMDVWGSSMADDGNIAQAVYTGASNQQFKFIDVGDGAYQLQAINSGKAVDVAEVSKNNGANIHQWAYVGGANQQFIAVSTGDGYYKLIAKHSGKLAEVGGFSTANGGNIQQWENVNQASGQWELIAINTAKSSKSSLKPQSDVGTMDINVYPNPVENTLKFTGKMSEIVVQIINPAGKLVSEQKVDSNNSIDVSKLSAGIYFITANKNGNQIVKKFLKK
jgi:hypothetical protein